MVPDRNNWFHRIGLLAIVITLIVVVLGAYVRLSDAGLGCPDWPGCYGHIGVPEASEDVNAANNAYPERPVEAAKAWKEMIHRYFASGLGLLILAMAIVSVFRARKYETQPKVLPWLLLALVIFQGLLGMWTVTLLVKPAVVTAHLIGGMSTLGLLFWVVFRQGRYYAPLSIGNAFSLKRWAMAGLLVLAAQIILGAWTSTNYAATNCSEFPSCVQGEYWPDNMDFKGGFQIIQELGDRQDYEGGVLDNAQRTAIHVVHRVGALVTTVVLLVLGLRLVLGERDQNLRKLGSYLIFALVLQLGIGIAMIWMQFPLAVATAHNGGAALLLLATLAINSAVRTTPGLR